MYFIDDIFLGVLTHGDAFDEWLPFSQLFTATSLTTELKIQDITFLYDYGGSYFDELSVMAVPEPSSFVLAAFGLLGMVVWRRRKR